MGVTLKTSEDVKLKKPVPVRFRYVTAWATAEGVTHFRHDLYGRDGIGSIVASYRKPVDDVETITP